MSKAGRPSKYGNNALKTAQEYVEKCYKGNAIPYIEELALILDVNDDTLVEWADKHDEFSATYKRLKMLQRLNLKRGALEKKCQPHIAMFLLKTNHGMDEPERPPFSEIEVKFVDPLTRAIEEANKQRELDEKKEQGE